MKEKLYNIIKLVISLLLFFSISYISTFIFKLLGINISKLSDLKMVLYQLVISSIMFIVLIIIYKDTIKDDYVKFNKNFGKNIKNVIKLFLIFMIVKYIVSFITVLIATIMKIDMNSITSVNQEIIQDYVKSAPLLMIISTSFLAPIYEEVLFRLGFKKVFGKGSLFVIISGFVFGLLHVFPLSDGVTMILGIIQSISYVTMGLFLAYIYKKYDNIFISIGVHFLNNFLSVLTMINLM